MKALKSFYVAAAFVTVAASLFVSSFAVGAIDPAKGKAQPDTKQDPETKRTSQ